MRSSAFHSKPVSGPGETELGLRWRLCVLASWLVVTRVVATTIAVVPLSSLNGSTFELAAAQSGYVGSEACAQCHADRFQNYRRTPMGRSLSRVSLGRAPEFARPVQFLHPKTGRRYRVFQKQKDFFVEEFSLDLAGRTVYSDLRRVHYTIGSGNHARSFLIERDGRLYQAPVTFYNRISSWDMSPGYDTENYVGFSRKITADCLFCHAGRANVTNAPGDRFESRNPFAEESIGCERCHGPGQEHIASPGKAIVNPAKLSPRLREQVCNQCHLLGAARVSQPGKSLADFRPGRPLEEFLAVYSIETNSSPGLELTGHAEQMKRSLCWRRSQDRLWCGSCHEVHSTVPLSKRAAVYRARCLSCHRTESCSREADISSPADRSNDCIGCHMPKQRVAESAHVTFTDHEIARRPGQRRAKAPETTRLNVLLPEASTSTSVSARNLGFAYLAVAGSTGKAEFAQLAAGILQALAETDLADAEFWENLGSAYLRIRQVAEAEIAYKNAVRLNPGSATTHYSLGYLWQLQKKSPEAIEAYWRALRLDPQMAEALGNLATAYFDTGRKSEAIKLLQAALRFEPGNLAWRQALESLKTSR